MNNVKCLFRKIKGKNLLFLKKIKIYYSIQYNPFPGEVLDDPSKAFVTCMNTGKWNISDGIWPKCVKSK